jgi:hypothetical protein
MSLKPAAAVLPSVAGGPGLDFIRHSLRFRVFRAPIYLVQAVFDLTDHLVDCSDRAFVSRQTAERQTPRQIVPYFLPLVHSHQHRTGDQ